MHQNRTKTVGACTHFIIWRKQKQSPKFSRKREREREDLPLDPCMQLVDQEWPWKYVPRPPLAADQLEVQAVMLTPGSKLFYHVPCSKKLHYTSSIYFLFLIRQKKKLHDTQALLWLKSRIIKSLEDERINNLLKFARTPLFLTCCNIWNQRPKISVATPNLCNMLRVKAAL